MNKKLTSRLIAHRGDMLNQPENSWRSLLASIESGARWVEFDVQMCGDGTLFLLHDDNLLRTTGVDIPVFNSSWESLADTSIHYPDLFKNRFNPTSISKLKEVLRSLSRHPQVRAMVEIKDESLSHFGIEPVMDTLLDELKNAKDQHVLISFNYEALVYAKKNSSLQIGWVVEKYNDEHLRRARQLNPEYLICNHKKIPSDEQPWTGKWQWMVYDIVDPTQARHWLENHVALVETGDISGMIRHGL